MNLPYRWRPSGTTTTAHPPVGSLVAYQHQVWLVVSRTRRPEDLWTDEDWASFRRGGEHYAVHALVLRPLGAAVGLHGRDRELHLATRGHRWDVYPDEHYPMCANCREPMPCREKVAAWEAAEAAQEMSRYETPGACPYCQDPITTRQRSKTFEENIGLPGGPPVTFHIGRDDCLRAASRYEKLWVSVDPNTRTVTLSCSGHVTNHADGTYECTQLERCPGPGAVHLYFATCECPECHATGFFDCYPTGKSRLVIRRTSPPTAKETPNHG